MKKKARTRAGTEEMGGDGREREGGYGIGRGGMKKGGESTGRGGIGTGEKVMALPFLE